MDQVHVYENLCADVINEGMALHDVFLANVLLEKFPPSWSEYRNHLKHKKKDLSLQELVGHMRTEEANRLKDKALKNVDAPAKANLVESSSAAPGNPTGSKKHAKGKNKAAQGQAKGKSKVDKSPPGRSKSLGKRSCAIFMTRL